MNLNRLNWDSDFFGYEIAKCLVTKEEPFNSESFYKNSDKFKLIYVFSEEPLTDNRLKLVDKKVVFEQKVKSIEIDLPQIKIFNKKEHSYSQLVNLAYASGIHSRFKIDKEFKNNEFFKLYKEWIDNSISQNERYEVLIYEEDRKILGLITYDIDNQVNSRIGLLAVHDEARGRGIATILLDSTKKHIYDKGITILEVSTQLDNIPARNLYRKCGFSIKNINYIYHFWNT